MKSMRYPKFLLVGVITVMLSFLQISESNALVLQNPKLKKLSPVALSANLKSIQISEHEEKAEELNIGDLIEGVCKTTLTTIAIGAWVTAYVFSEGALMSVARWTVKYLTLPSIICTWL